MEHELVRYPMSILISHLDTFGHVNNSKYMEIFEEARWWRMYDKGFTMNVVHESQCAPIVLSATLRFRKELLPMQEVTVTIQCASYRSRTAVLHQMILNEAEEVCADADFEMALLSLTTRRIIRPTRLWNAVLGLPHVE